MTVLGAAVFTVPIEGEIVRPRCGGSLTTALDAAEPPSRNGLLGKGPGSSDLASALNRREGAMGGVDALLESLRKDITRFDGESAKHKILYRRCETLVIVLTALSSVVAGAGLVLPERTGPYAQFTVLLLTTTTAAISSWERMRRARELWQHEREVYYALLDVQREIEFVASNRPLTSEELEQYFRRIAAVLGSSSQKWARIQQKKEGQLEPAGGGTNA